MGRLQPQGHTVTMTSYCALNNSLTTMPIKFVRIIMYAGSQNDRVNVLKFNVTLSRIFFL